MDQLVELTRLTVVNIVDNETDGMSSACPCLQTKQGLAPSLYESEILRNITSDAVFDMGRCCNAAHGLSLLLVAEFIDGEGKEQMRQLLFDAGPEPDVWRLNARRLGIALAEIDAVALSHYHIDHCGGLRSAVPDISKARQLINQGAYREDLLSKEKSSGEALVVDLHSSQIVTRGFKLPNGEIIPMTPNNPNVVELESYGAKVELHDDAHSLCDECFYVSGRIPRVTSFETGLPGHFTKDNSGKWIADEEIPDERYVACKIRGRGVVVFSACSHAGIVNVCQDAMKKSDAGLSAVIGGFHLAGSSVEGRISKTVEDLKKIGPDVILAGH